MVLMKPSEIQVKITTQKFNKKMSISLNELKIIALILRINIFSKSGYSISTRGCLAERLLLFGVCLFRKKN